MDVDDIRPLPHSRAAIIVVGLGYGDEAKGATVDFLASTLPDTVAVVRWSGGAQAAHNVVHGPRHHTFRQFGSASLLDVATMLRAPMIFDPLALGVEAEELRRIGVADPLGLVTVDGRCLVGTPIHAAMNRAREEARGDERHGSCGMGIGETIAYALAARGRDAGNLAGGGTAPGSHAITASDLRSLSTTVQRLDELMAYARPLLGEASLPSVTEMARDLVEVAGHVRIVEEFDDRLGAALAAGSVLFEGSQGVLLDEYAGFHPHTTWATTSPAARLPGPRSARDDVHTATGLSRVGLRTELERAGAWPYVLGLTRTYATRHGAGPLPTEAAAQDFAEPHNGRTYQGSWRQGALDLTTLRYAARVAGVDGIGVSHLDAPVTRISAGWRGGAGLLSPLGCDVRDENTRRASLARPRYVEVAAPDVPALIEDDLGVPVVVTAAGPRRIDRTLHVPAAPTGRTALPPA